MLKIPITILPGNEDLPLPAYQTAHAAAMDLCAAIAGPVVIAPGEILLVGCGFAIAVPDGFEAQVRPRSGLAARSGITVVNAPGTIDPDYRGEVKVALINLGARAFTVERGMRIAQLLVAPVARVAWERWRRWPRPREARADSDTQGESGTGSTSHGGPEGPPTSYADHGSCTQDMKLLQRAPPGPPYLARA